MKLFGMSMEELNTHGAIHTAREIYQQPKLWQKVWDQMEGEAGQLQAFLAAIEPVERIILTGAGTSAFIGLSLHGLFQKKFGVQAEAISTTDIVSHPNNYFIKEVPTLLISFARSGNSPESVAAVKLADELCANCAHIIITCNAEGQLGLYETKGKKYIFTLPEEANDKSLAMTSSYSSMLLSGILIAHIHRLQECREQMNYLIKYGEKSIHYYADEIKEVAKLNFRRAVFLGAGPMFGTATEAQLKLQELTDGRVICKNDSFLGFRHGPKAVIDETTLVVYIFSNDPYALKYEEDLVGDVKRSSKPMMEIGISENKNQRCEMDKNWFFSENDGNVEEEFLAVSSIVPLQLLGFFTSLHLGLKPDAPSASGAITRVVEGVNIYSRM